MNSSQMPVAKIILIPFSYKKVCLNKIEIIKAMIYAF